MNKRILKQILYSFLYIALLGLIGFGVYLLFSQTRPTCFDQIQNQGETGVDCGGPCIPCEIKALSPLTISWAKYFPVTNETIVIAEIKNSNSNYGADSFSYTINATSKTGEVKTLTDTSFIYAGETKYIFQTINVNSTEISQVEVNLSNPDWKTVSEFPQPDTRLEQVKTTIDKTNKKIFINGSFANLSAVRFSKVRLIGLLYNKDGVVLGASKTELDNVRAFDELSFVINFPFVNPLPDTAKTVVYAETIK